MKTTARVLRFDMPWDAEKDPIGRIINQWIRLQSIKILDDGELKGTLPSYMPKEFLILKATILLTKRIVYQCRLN